MKKILISILLLSQLSSCCKRVIGTTTSTTFKTETTYKDSTRYIDTTFHIDSSVSIAHIICDTLLVPHLVSVDRISGKKTVSVRTAHAQSGRFTITCPADSLSAIIAVKDKYITSLSTTMIKERIAYESKSGFWYKLGEFAKYILTFLLGIILGAISYAIYRR